MNFIIFFLLAFFISSLSFSEELNFNNRTQEEYEKVANLTGSTKEIQKKTEGIWPRMRDGSEYSKGSNEVEISENKKYIIIKTNNIPNHKLVTNNPHCAEAKKYTFKIPKIPLVLNKPKKITKEMQEIGVAINGIVIAGPYDSQNKIAPYNRQVGPCGAHSDKEGMYHYHFAPLCLINNGEKIALNPNSQIGWSFDGFKIKGLVDRNKHKPQLDDSNGHEHDGEYHYHATIDFPFFMGSYKAKPVSSNFTQKKPGTGSDTCPEGVTIAKKGSGKKDGKGRPNFEHATKVLGLSEEEIKHALGPPPPDLDSASKKLGISLDKLESALFPN